MKVGLERDLSRCALTGRRSSRAHWSIGVYVLGLRQCRDVVLLPPFFITGRLLSSECVAFSQRVMAYRSLLAYSRLRNPFSCPKQVDSLTLDPDHVRRRLVRCRSLLRKEG